MKRPIRNPVAITGSKVAAELGLVIIKGIAITRLLRLSYSWLGCSMKPCDELDVVRPGDGIGDNSSSSDGRDNPGSSVTFKATVHVLLFFLGDGFRWLVVLRLLAQAGLVLITPFPKRWRKGVPFEKVTPCGVVRFTLPRSSFRVHVTIDVMYRVADFQPNTAAKGRRGWLLILEVCSMFKSTTVPPVQKWISTLQRQCECLATIMSPDASIDNSPEKSCDMTANPCQELFLPLKTNCKIKGHAYADV
ncbi:hypothetical protein Tco_1457656 [Tanacetum coccineum]